MVYTHVGYTPTMFLQIYCTPHRVTTELLPELLAANANAVVVLQREARSARIQVQVYVNIALTMDNKT